MTPNVMARTIETVAGGGLVIILLHSVHSLHQIYSMEMVKLIILLKSNQILVYFSYQLTTQLVNNH